MKVKVKVKRKNKAEKITEIPISTDFIKLDAFLKFANVAETGGMAKILVEEGEVSVNGEVCLQRGKKLRAGDVVSVMGENFSVAAGQ